ncbi:opsin 8, group member c [Clupea harengus]|uniref:Opsin 8, group member c n=1 Tax=Clupea harengus TaxID=7950 RepID=A0A8M1KP67_CLUHA|nr:opsin 8, group member c [Clupea harengus]
MAWSSPENGTLDWTRNISVFTSKLSPTADIGVGIVILIVVLLSVLGNGTVLATSYRRRHKLTDSELLCVNLALADFLGCVCFYPLSLISSFHHAWLGGYATCVYYGLGCYILGLCGMFTIAAISVIRYIKTFHGALYGANMQLLCISTWLLAAVWSFLPLFGWGEYVPEPYGLSCTIAWRRYHTSVKDAIYVICSFACFTLVPALLIVASQVMTLRKVYRITNLLTAHSARSNLKRTEKRLSVMFFCVSMGFVVAWAPYAVVSFLFIFHTEAMYMAPSGFVFPALFAKSSHVYNPLIYFYFNKAFRQELRGLLRCLFPGLASRRVGVRQVASQVPAPAIQIQLQEQQEGGGRGVGGGGGVRGMINLVKSQSRSSKGSLSAGREGHSNDVFAYCRPKIRVVPLVLGPGVVREFLPIST